jgi:hypothetical protein
LDYTTYESEYKKIEWKIIWLEKKLQSIETIYNTNHNLESFTPQELSLLASFISNFNLLLNNFYNNLPNPIQFKTKIEHNTPIQLWDIEDNSSTSLDISLSSDELSQLSPDRLLWESKNWIKYFLINFKWKDTIMKYNAKKDSDEVWLYIWVEITWNETHQELIRIIENAERQWFKDIEIQWGSRLFTWLVDNDYTSEDLRKDYPEVDQNILMDPKKIKLNYLNK